MSDRVSLILCRYQFDEDGNPTAWREQFRVFDQLKDARPIAYRKSDPGPDEYDTYLMLPKQKEIFGYYCITLDVVKDVRFRQIVKADRINQTLSAEFVGTEEVVKTHVVIVPELGALAVEDGSGDGSLSGQSGASRLQAIVQATKKYTMKISPAGTPQDLARAISTWSLDEFSFQARPFNPHPANPGEMLSEMLAKDEIGEFRGVAVPRDGRHIHPKANGIVKEAIGLAEHGYATYGARGETPSGAEAVVKKQPFSYDRDKNLERLRGPQQLRIYINAEKEEDRELKSVKVIAEFFAAAEQPQEEPEG